MFALYFLFTLLLLGFLIFVHEGGHFIVARLNGITVNEFAIGMGPKIVSKTSEKSGTIYSLRLFPIGGFVSMAGEDGESDDENAFYKKNVWRRIATVIAGPVTNVLIGFIGMFILVCVTSTLGSNVIADFSEGAVSCNQGLQVNDRIIAINSTGVHTADEVVYEIMNQAYRPIDITVERNGEKIKYENVTFPTVTEDGVSFGNYDFIFYAEHKNVGTVIKHSFWRSLSTVKMVWDSVVSLVTGRFGIEEMSGPIGITETVGTAVNTSWKSVLYLFVIIAVNLGVMNLLPLPALDGGRLIFLLIEAVTGKTLDRNIEGYINFAGLALLMLLTVIITVKDVVNLF